LDIYIPTVISHGRGGTMNNFNFQQGDRVKLIMDIPDKTTDVHPVEYFKGDTGTINYVNGQAGFMSDRYGDITSLRRRIGSRAEFIVNYCVIVTDSDV
jgi:ribosomal protein L21E